MSLFWEHAVSSSPTQQNVDSSALIGTAGGQQGQTNGSWDCINLGNLAPQQQQYSWNGQSVGASSEPSRLPIPNYVDPYSAAVMGGYQQGTQNVVYPYQQHEVPSGNYVQSCTPHGGSTALHNFHYQQPQQQQQQQRKNQQQIQPQHSNAQQQQQEQAKSSTLLNAQPVSSQHVHHTLIPTKQHVQPSSHQPRTVEQMSVTSSTTVLPSSELQSVPLAVISPAVALSSTMSSHPNPLSTVQPFNSRSTSVEAEPERKQPIVLDSNVRRPIGEEEISRRPSLSCLAVHPLLSLESTPPASSANDESVVAQVGDSAQVTPESSYSVDTFGSGISSNADNCERQRVANSAGTAVHQVVTLTGDNWWDEWERAGGNPDTPIEITPSDVASQTQSEPAGYSSGYADTQCATRESSSAAQPHSDSDPGHRNDAGADVFRVASVPATPSAVIGVPRYEEPCRSQDHVPAVAQVAPLRPEPEPIQPAPVSSPSADAQTPAHRTDLLLDLVHVPQIHQPSRSSAVDTVSTQPTTTMTEDADMSMSIHFPSDADNQGNPSSEVGTTSQHRATPDVAATNENAFSPVVQATSTPVNAVDASNDTRERNYDHDGWERSSERRVPHSSTHPSIAANATADHSDSTTGSLSTRNAPERRSVQSRYKKFKEHFSGIMGRLDQYRTEPSRSEFRASSRSGNPLMVNVTNRSLSVPSYPISVLGRRSVLAAAATKNPSQVRSIDGSFLYNAKSDDGSPSVYQHRGDATLIRPFIPAVYGDDFVDAARRSRRSRLSRPNSRAKSEFGVGIEDDPFDPSLYVPPPAPYGNYPNDRRSVHSSMGVSHPQEYYVHQAHMYNERRRPQSSFDQRAMERFQRAGGRYGQYDTFGDTHSSVSEESDSDNGERGDSEEEIRKYTQKGRFGGPGESFDTLAVGEEMYYFGAIHLDQARVRSILANFPPPVEYHRLPPIEKAAYLFFVAVYRKQYSDVGDFHRKFNREYYKYTCDGDSDNVALWKICKSMQEEYHAKRLAESQKAYEASQRQLFSDDRDSVDGKEDDFIPLGDRPRRLILRTSSAPSFMSERASMDENHDDRTSDILSIDSSQRAPLKHRVPHAFVSFGPGGKMVTVHPDLSVSVVQIDDIKSLVTDPYSVRLIDSAQTFKGPLLIGQTPTHSVRLYIERQIKRIRNSELAAENPHDNDVVDCLLIWQLLGVIVQQQGRVTGPDVARLLVEVGSVPSKVSSATHQALHSNREKNVAPPESTNNVIGPVRNQTAMDARSYDRFTELLLGGHIEEAIDSALRDGLYADAMILARRLLAHDLAKLAEIEERFLATRPQCNPVVTLVSVSSKKLVPILMNPTGDEGGSWRTHAAIILANLTSAEAMETVYDLGKVLAKRDYNCAADFCFLAVCVLAGINPFRPIPAASEGEARQHITLIHAGLPDDDVTAVPCRYGFSLTDLHATEIFDYAIRLSDANAYSPLSDSLEYQRKRIQYAHLVAQFGGFATDAFKYCMEIARAIWNYYNLLSIAELNGLCDLADRLRFAASANDWETSWITSLRAMIQQKQQSHAVVQPQVAVDENQQLAAPLLPEQRHPQSAEVKITGDVGLTSPPHPELPLQNRSRSGSLASEARDWHAQRQDPLQMSPVASHVPAAVNVEENDGRVSRSRTVSNASQQGYCLDVHARPNAEISMPPSMAQYMVGHGHPHSQDPPSNSENTSAQSTTESTPVRAMNHQHETMHLVTQPVPDHQHISQPPMPQTMPHVTHHAATQNDRHSAHISQANGLPDTNMKKSSSTQGAKGFLGNIKEKLLKAIPSGNEMILPDDSKPTIIWDPVKGRYVGAGVEEETMLVPPPKLDGLSQIQSSSGGLRAARTSGGSRYFNPLNQASTNGAATPPPAAPMPVMQVPATFGFIPSMPDDTGESVDPFSGQASPTVHGAELTSAQ